MSDEAVTINNNEPNSFTIRNGMLEFGSDQTGTCEVVGTADFSDTTLLDGSEYTFDGEKAVSEQLDGLYMKRLQYEILYSDWLRMSQQKPRPSEEMLRDIEKRMLTLANEYSAMATEMRSRIRVREGGPGIQRHSPLMRRTEPDDYGN